MLELTDVLRGGRQCDEDGMEIIMSREACCVAADEIERLRKVIDTAAHDIQCGNIVGLARRLRESIAPVGRKED